MLIWFPFAPNCLFVPAEALDRLTILPTCALASVQVHNYTGVFMKHFRRSQPA